MHRQLTVSYVTASPLALLSMWALEVQGYPVVFSSGHQNNSVLMGKEEFDPPCPAG